MQIINVFKKTPLKGVDAILKVSPVIKYVASDDTYRFEEYVRILNPEKDLDCYREFKSRKTDLSKAKVNFFKVTEEPHNEEEIFEIYFGKKFEKRDIPEYIYYISDLKEEDFKKPLIDWYNFIALKSKKKK